MRPRSIPLRCARCRRTACSGSQGDSPGREVLVDAGQLADVDQDAGFLEDLAAYAVLGPLVQLQHPAGELPGAVVRSLDRQQAPVLAHHCAGHR